MSIIQLNQLLEKYPPGLEVEYASIYGPQRGIIIDIVDYNFETEDGPVDHYFLIVENRTNEKEECIGIQRIIKTL